MKKLNIAQGVITFLILSLWLGVAVGTLGLVTKKEGTFYEILEPHLEVKDEAIQEKLREALTANIPDPIQIRVESMRISKPLDVRMKISVMAMVIITTSYITYVLNLFKNVIQDVRASNSFSLENIQRVKLLGLLITLQPPVDWVVGKMIVWWYRSQYQFEGVDVVLNQPFGLWIFLLGLMILVLGVAVEQGQKIQQENELTI